MKTIIVNSKKWFVFDWVEKPTHPLAGIHPEVQQRLDAEAREREPMMPQNWDVQFECHETTFQSGTPFSVKDDTRQFVVLSNNGKKHWAEKIP